MKAVNIEWDIDGEEGVSLDDLPNEIKIPDEIQEEDDISDYLSDITGFCHKGFSLVD